jgi:hypothetical protein
MRYLLLGSISVVALVAAMAVNGQLPGLTPAYTSSLLTQAGVACQSHHLFSVSCPDVGLPVGQYTANGLMPYFVGGLIAALPGINPHAALELAALIFCACSLWGTVGLCRRLAAASYLGVAAGALYLVSPTIVGLGGFTSTLWGFVLLPTALEIDLRFYEIWQDGDWRKRSALMIGWIVAKSALLLTDGYAFVVCATVAGIVLLSWALVSRQLARAKLTAVVVFALSNGIAYVVYKKLLGQGTDLQKSSPNLFRAMGLDLTSLLRPTGFWWLGSHGYATQLGSLWGDTSNALYNYVGYFCVILALVGIVLLRRNRFVAPLLVALVVTFIFSLGPSLKIGNHRVTPPPGQVGNLYSMPAEAATASLPTAPLFRSVPGMDIMRATYRWFGGTRLILIVLATGGVGELNRRSRGRRGALVRQTAVFALGTLAVLELVPAPRALRNVYLANHNIQGQVDVVAAELDASLGDGERVAFVSLVPGSFPNDYLAPYISAQASIRTSNLATDKSVKALLDRWPKPIHSLMLGIDVDGSARASLQQHLTDAVVVPYFDLRGWVQNPSFPSRGHRLAQTLKRDPHLLVTSYAHFAIIKLSGN